MAATVTNRGSAWTTTAGNKTVTATPAVGDLIVIIAPSTGVATSAVSDNQSGTYVKVDSTRTGFSTSGNLTAWVRTALISSATSTTFTATQTSSTGGGLIVYSVSGMSATGASAIRSSGGQSSGTSGTTPAPVLSLTPVSSNPIIAAVANGTSAATLTPRTGYTEDLDLGYSTPTSGFEAMHRASGETLATITWGSTSASAFASIALELAYDAAPNAPTLNSPADTATVSTVTPQLDFTGTDANTDAISYEIEVDSANTFNSGSTLTPTTAGTTTGTYSGSASFSVTEPSGVQPGDLLLIVGGFNTGGVVTWTPPTGFSTYHNNPGDSNSTALVIFYRVADGTEASSFTVTTSRFIDGGYGCIAIRNIDQTTPIIAISADYNTGGTGTSSFTANSVTLGGTYDAVSLLLSTGQAGATTLTYPSGWNASPDGLYKDDGTEFVGVGGDLTVQSAVTSLPSKTIGLSAGRVGATNQLALQAAHSPQIDKLSASDTGFADSPPSTPSVIQSTTGGGSFVTSLTTSAFGSSVTTGNAIIVGIAYINDASPITSVTDSNGNIYARIDTIFNSSASMGIDTWISTDVTGGASFTVTVNASAHDIVDVIAYEASGIPLQGYTDNFGTYSSSTSTNNSVSASVTTAYAKELLIHFAMSDQTVGTWTADASFTNLAQVDVAANFAGQTKVVSSTNTYAPTLTKSSTAGHAVSIILALKASGYDPFPSGDTISFTVPGGGALTNGTTYYWRARGIDPSGSNTYGSWSSTRSFTVSTGSVLTNTQPAVARVANNLTKTQGAIATVTRSMATFADPFNQTSVDSTKWAQATAGGATLSFDATGATVTYPSSSTASTAGSVSAKANYDLTGSYAYLQVLAVPSSSTNADAEMALLLDSNNWLRWVYEGGTLYAQYMVAGTRNNATTFTYNSTTHKLWRIRESGGTIYWDTSADGSSWTNQASVANPISVKSLNAVIDGSCYEAETNPGTYKWNDFNTPPATVRNTTQSAVARIANNLTTSQGAKARIQKAVSKTQGAVARIANGLAKTQSAIARISNTKTTTQPATARIQMPVAKTQSATARIVFVLTKTQGAIARIAQNYAKTQTSVARIASTSTKTQGATARVAAILSKTQGALGRIAVTMTKTQSATSRIANTLTKTQSATATISMSSANSKTQSAVARIANIVAATQSALARIAVISAKIQSATARIQRVLAKTQSAVARIANMRTNTQSAVARIAITPTKTQAALARIANTRSKTQAAIARISNVFTKTQGAVARISNTPTKTQSAVARIQQRLFLTQSATANIIQSGISQKTQSAVARIQRALSTTQPALARIATIRAKTQMATARIAQTYAKTQSAKSRIAQTATKTQPAKARIARTLAATQPATGRIQVVATKTLPAVSRISQTYTRVQSANSRISKIFTTLQSAIARIANQLSLSQSAVARIERALSATQSCTARIITGTELIPHPSLILSQLDTSYGTLSAVDSFAPVLGQAEPQPVLNAADYTAILEQSDTNRTVL